MFDMKPKENFKTEAKPFVARVMDMARTSFGKLLSISGPKQTNSGPAAPHR